MRQPCPVIKKTFPSCLSQFFLNSSGLNSFSLTFKIDSAVYNIIEPRRGFQYIISNFIIYSVTSEGSEGSFYSDSVLCDLHLHQIPQEISVTKNPFGKQ